MRVQVYRHGHRRGLHRGPILGQGMGMGESGRGHGLVIQVRGVVKKQTQGRHPHGRPVAQGALAAIQTPGRSLRK